MTYPAHDYQAELLAKLANPRFVADVAPILRASFFSPPWDAAAKEAIALVRKGGFKTPLTRGQIAQLCQRHDVKLEKAANLNGDFSFDRQEVMAFGRIQIVQEALLQAHVYKEQGKPEKAVQALVEARSRFPVDVDHSRFRDILDPNNPIPKRRNVIGTGLPTLDSWLNGGPAAGNVAVCLSATGDGKTSWLVWLGSQAVRQGKHVRFLSCEMPLEEIDEKFRRAIAQDRIMPTRTKWAATCKQVLKKGGSLTCIRLRVGMTVRDLDLDLGPDCNLLLIDDADYLRSDRASKSLESMELGYVYKDLKQLAMDREIPIWAVSQVHRASYGNDVHELSGVAWSIEKVLQADIVVSLTSQGEPEKDGRQYGNIYLPKHRHGKKKLKLPVTMDFARNVFTEGLVAE